MREGSAVADFLNPPYTILGASDTKHLARCANCTRTRGHALRNDHSGGGNGEVFLELLSRAEGWLRQRNGNHVQASRRGRACGHQDFHVGYEAEYFSGLSFSRVCVWRVMPAEDLRAITYKAKNSTLSCPCSNADAEQRRACRRASRWW